MHKKKLSILLLTLLSCYVGISQSKKPNFVIILADDLGYADVGYQGCKEIPTPNIDKIANGGVKFSTGYVTCPVCAPSRAGMLTGRYQTRFGFEDNPGPWVKDSSTKIGMPASEKTIAQYLQENGYYTGLVGKFHEGDSPEFWPTHRGYNEFFGFIDGKHEYEIGDNKDKKIRRNETPVAQENEYLTDAFGREAVSFIDRNHTKPFLLYLAFNAVHEPLTVPDKYLAKFGKIKDERRRRLAAMAYAMDYNIGKVLETLDRYKLSDNTMIIFCSDNGGKYKENASLNTPLRGTKMEMYEGGIRVPMCIRWPSGKFAKKQVSAPVITLDFLPTILAAAGARRDEKNKLDGVNLLPFLQGKQQKVPHDILYWRFMSQWAIRDANWKLVMPSFDEGEHVRLYNISKDISESNNLADKHPEIVERLKKSYNEWQSQMVPRLWGWGGSDIPFKASNF